MPTKRGYNRYIHTLRTAYESIGVASSHLSRPGTDVVGLTAEDALNTCFPYISQRLALLGENGASAIFDEPKSVHLYFHDRPVLIPLINQEGYEWYSNTPMFVYDFLIESFLGMHSGANVIYDIGGHQGVWALFYSGSVGEGGRVYTYEPSILNVECAALSFFMNDAENVLLNAIGLAETPSTIHPNENGLLISGVTHKMNLLPLGQLMWDKPDFIKIDIEGYEYNIVKSNPHIFDMCENIHLEIHIPFLENRSLNYRDIYELIPFDKFRVRRSIGAELFDLTQDDHLEGFCTLLLTPKY